MIQLILKVSVLKYIYGRVYIFLYLKKSFLQSLDMYYYVYRYHRKKTVL
jgi:hypothetical protein